MTTGTTLNAETEMPFDGLFVKLAADLAAGGDLRGLLQRFLEAVMRIAGAQAGAVRVLSADRLEMVSHLGLPEHVIAAERSVDPGCGVCGAAFASDVVARLDDLQHCRRRSEDRFFGHDCQHVLAVPLTCRGRVLGVYNLFFAAEPAVDANALTLFKAIGELLGLALENAKLEQENLRTALARERQSMAAEVHDSVAQTLAFVKMRMPLLDAAIASHDEAGARLYARDVRQAVTSAHTHLRELLSDFRTPMDPLGLKHALRSSILAFSERTQVALAFDDQAPELRLSAAQESQVFHIVQEALANIAKHAQAKQVWLRIERSGDGIDVVVEDDGSGAAHISELATPNHFGIGIMRDRALRLGGSLNIGPRQGGGTQVRLSFPWSGESVAAA